MELSEVVSAHFAFPVVGVVLCAVLVFAFGFKSPAQPPSFDLLDDDDDRKYKKSRQKKHKLNIDGHVINIDGHGSPGAKVMTKQQQTTLNRQAMNEKQDTKVKTKKLKPVTDSGVVNENLPEQDEDAGATGEWTKAVSKKDRKHRSKKDDGSRKDDFPAAAAAAGERTSPSHEIQKTVQVTHPTVNSRDEVHSNRTQRRTLEVTVTAPAPAPVPVVVSCTAVPAGPHATSVNPDSFSSRVKATVVSVTIASTFQSEPQKSAITSREQTVKTSSPASIPKPLASIPKPLASIPKPLASIPKPLASIPKPLASIPKPLASIPKPLQSTPGKGSEAAAAANVIQLPGEDDAKVPSVSASVTTGVKNSAEDKSSEKCKDSSATVTVGDSKPAKSPKKKKKSPESREKYKESPVVTIPADVTVSSATVTAEPRHIVKPVNSDTPTAEIQTVASRSASETDASTSCVQCRPLPSDDRSAEKTCPTIADNNLPLSDSKITADVAHPASDSKTTAGVEYPASDSKTTAGVDHPASDSKTTAGVDHPASDTQPVGDLQPASDNCSGGDSQPPTLADELGDWQEAKPLKKKRKPHREN